MKKGDMVTWNTPQGKTEGTVTKKITTDEKVAGHTVRASVKNPQYEVKSNKTGKKAAHKPNQLNKAS